MQSRVPLGPGKFHIVVLVQNPFEAGNQLNASSNHALLITKSALVIKKNALFLSQSAFSNFDPHLINKLISLTPNSTSGLPVPRYIFPLVLLAVEDSKTEKISFVNTLSYWFIFLFSFPLGTFSTLNQQLSNYLDYRLVKLFIFALNAALLFHGDDIHARIAFRRRVKDVENIVRKHTQFIKG